MLVLNDSFKSKIKENTYIALGSFDGLHMGHLKLINKAKKLANINSGQSMVFAFKNHPLSVIYPELAPKILMSNATKLQILSVLKVDIVNLIDFDKNFMTISPEDFIANIVKTYNAKGIVVGYNYRFGYKNLGDVELLEELSKQYGYDLHVIEPVTFENETISSSRIRNALNEGNINKANLMLTRSYEMSGKVIVGKQLGRTIGFPTVNLDYNKMYVIPRGGVYITNLEYDGILYKGITNVGYNPTFMDNKLNIETYIFDFEKEIYNETVKIFFLNRIRDEKKFNSVEALTLQMQKDKIIAEKYF